MRRAIEEAKALLFWKRVLLYTCTKGVGGRQNESGLSFSLSVSLSFKLGFLSLFFKEEEGWMDGSKIKEGQSRHHFFKLHPQNRIKVV